MQVLCDLGRRGSQCGHRQHLLLAPRQCLVGRLHVGGRRRARTSRAVGPLHDGRQQRLRTSRLGQKGVGSGLEHGGAGALVGVGRQHHDVQRRIAQAQRAHPARSRHPGHAQVQHQQIGAVRRQQRHHLFPRTGLVHRADWRLRLGQHHLQTLAHDAVVIGNQDAQRGLRRREIHRGQCDDMMCQNEAPL
ncbi:hypothetical protein D3C72_1809380 [compost metagenome]